MNKWKLVTTSLAFALVAGLTGCDSSDGPAEEAGKKMDEAMETTKEKLEELGDKMSDAMDSAGDKMSDAMDTTEEKMEETGDKIKEATE
ncbi:hypothetical protein [Motiliproteus sp. SC1-56]|uniref:hypothetical protein n=1 Tax=Motiliproteus sp. SC1-56 TaxID=2799565 RepID=UPI001A8D99C6|nr:hypothetical protein [Motiliproteus sp. SC1-56]